MRLAVALCALLGLGPSAPVRAEPARFALRLEAGGEYDSNAGRVERVDGATAPKPIVGAPVGRLVLTSELAAPLGNRHVLSLFASAAGKSFRRAEARSEDVLVVEASGGWTFQAGDRTALGLHGAYYDVFQRRGPEARDFRSTTPTLRLEQGVGEGSFSLGAGYRWLTYKPEAQLDFAGPTAFLLYRHLLPGDAGTGGADWEWSGGLAAELRDFTGTRCLDVTACPGPVEAGRRRDQFWMFHLEATRTGAFLAGAGLAFHGNLSNSYGEQLLRGLAHVRAVFLLPADLSLSARIELVATRYGDAVPLARNLLTGTPLVSIEDESRSTARVELARPFGRHVDAGLRYTLYTNELAGGPVHYRRQTALLFLAVLAP
jgi:hypothetical protein